MLSRTAWVGLAAVGVCVVGLGGAAAQSAGSGSPAAGLEMMLPGAFGMGGPLARHDGPFARMMTGRIGRLMVLKSELGVTPEQRTKLKEIGMAHRSEIGPSLEKVGGTFRGLRDAVLAEKGDEGMIRKAADEHGKAVGDLAVVLSKVAKEGREVLTEEQRGQIQTFLAANDEAAAKMRKEMKEKFGVK